MTVSAAATMAAALLLPACVTSRVDAPQAPVAAPDAAGWREAASDDGRATVAWRPEGGALLRNEPMRLEVRVEAAGAPAAGASLVVRGRMPEHGHGLVAAPLVTARGDGSFLVENLLLHMRGRWELLFDVCGDGWIEIVTFDVDL